MLWKSVVAAAVTSVLLSTVTFADEVADAIKTIQSVQPASKGTADARRAVSALARGGAKNLIPVLQGFRSASPLAANWLRNAFDNLASAEAAAGRKLPEQPLTSFVRDTQESPVARRLAYEWLLKQNPELKTQLIPGMLLDPSAEFRRDAVAMLLEQAAAAPEATSLPLYQKALSGAVHKDQVDTIAAAIRKAGSEINIQNHFGFLADWKVIGPFDNKEEKGFDVAYPPETELREDAEYDGQLGKVSWKPVNTEDDYGILDIAKKIQNYKGSVMYASTTWTSDKDRQLELRLGTPNAWKLWVNGKMVFGREEYHRGTEMDQYKIPVQLKAGSNTILLKICQNEQTQDWAQSYHFQIRVCDATGAAVSNAPKTAQTEPAAKGTN